jgi:outer membrane translocation and assembly module TamA
MDQRMRTDMDLEKDMLHTFGYYAGEARGTIRRVRGGEDRTGETQVDTAQENTGVREEPESNAYTVTINLHAGRSVPIGKTRVAVTEPFRLKPDETGEKKRHTPAATIADVWLKEGDPAIAGNVLVDAVAEVRENFHDRGYSYAKVVSSKYTVDHSAKNLNAEVMVDSGPLTYMGELEIKGESSVTRNYLEVLSTWKPGWVWNPAPCGRVPRRAPPERPVHLR